MRKRFDFSPVTARIDGQPFLNTGGDVVPASMAALVAVRDNALPNNAARVQLDKHLAVMPNSRMRGA